MKRLVQVSAAALVSCLLFAASSHAQGITYHDDFTTLHDYHTGTVPVGGIWTGVNNAANGDNGALVAKFVANGEDAFGTPKPGVLFMEDLNGGPTATGVGFEGARNTAPMIYREVDSAQDFDAKVKIDAQTAGQWSSAGIVARRAGPPIGVAPLDPTEQFVAAYSFRTDNANPGNATVLTKSIVNGAQVTDANVVFTTAGAPAPTAPLPVWIRLLKQGSTFTSQSSLDGTTWFTKTVVTNAAPLAAAGGMIQIGPSFMMFGGGQGTVDFDFFDLFVGPSDPLFSTWGVAGGGNWNNAINWNPSIPAPGIPNSNQVEVTFGAAAMSAATIFTDANVTAKKLIFNNANKYAVAGTGTITLAAATGNASIEVQVGSHEIQAATTLSTSNLTITTSASTRLDVNNRFNLNGRTVTITGPGVVSFNNNLVTGSGGTVTNSATLQGTGRINGNLFNSTGGTVSPGNSAGTLTVNGNYGQVAGTPTLLMELGGTGADQFDKLVVGGSFTAAGKLTVQLINGFTPSAGNSFDILDFTTASAPSLVLNLPALSSGLTWNTSSLLTTGVLSVTGPAIDADFNNDGTTDGDDLLIWQRNLGASGATNAQGDTDGNGLVNGADLTNWKNRFGMAVPVSSAVPEPAAWTLLTIAAVGLAARRRR